jgi:hypothetical protein
MGKIHPNQIESFDDEPIKKQKMKKRTHTETEELPKQKPRSNKRK